MSNDAMREAFERAYREKFPNMTQYRFQLDEMGEYEDGAIFVGYAMWQAALAAPAQSDEQISVGVDVTTDGIYVTVLQGNKVVISDNYSLPLQVVVNAELYAFAATQLAEMDFRADPAEREKRAELFVLLQRARGE